jgi:D-arabinose 1-dehydrogenase-like Zn-dependent alcohol dehydrogenase
LKGLEGTINTGLMLMKRLAVHGILVDSREAFEHMVRFLADQRIEPMIDRRFGLKELPEALRYMRSGAHFGKIVLTRD